MAAAKESGGERVIFPKGTHRVEVPGATVVFSVPEDVTAERMAGCLAVLARARERRERAAAEA